MLSDYHVEKDDTPLIDLHARKRLAADWNSFELDLDLQISEGEFVNLYGKSGAGKTTTLRMLAGLSKPDEGHLRVGNETWFDSIHGVNVPPQHRRIGFVFQDYALFPNMSVRRNLAYAGHGTADKEKINAILDQMDLGHLAERKPHTLSGGQKQRVALARALMRNPKLLLLDEPLSALDSSTRSRIQDDIKKMHERLGMTTILVSHELSEIFKLCSRMIVIDQGKILKTGSPGDIFIARKMSGKFRFEGAILAVERSDVVFVLTIAIGGNMVKVIATAEEAQFLEVGDRVVVVSKAFNPILLPMKELTPEP